MNKQDKGDGGRGIEWTPRREEFPATAAIAPLRQGVLL